MNAHVPSTLAKDIVEKVQNVPIATNRKTLTRREEKAKVTVHLAMQRKGTGSGKNAPRTNTPKGERGCFHWEKGHCLNGDKCEYKHDLADGERDHRQN